MKVRTVIERYGPDDIGMWSIGIVATVRDPATGRYCNIVDDTLRDGGDGGVKAFPRLRYWVYYHFDPADQDEYEEGGGYPSLSAAIEAAKQWVKPD